MGGGNSPTGAAWRGKVTELLQRTAAARTRSGGAAEAVRCADNVRARELITGGEVPDAKDGWTAISTCRNRQVKHLVEVAVV